MNKLTTSSGFAAAGTRGTDWRDTSKSVLEQLENVKTEGFKPNIGFLYITDHLAEDAESIINLFRSVLNIDHWVGTIGVGVFSNGERFIDEPGISAMIGYIDPDEFFIFDQTHSENNNEAGLNAFLKERDPMLILTHSDPMADQDPADAMKALEEQTSGFIIGGVSSSRHTHTQFAGEATNNGLSGIVFSQSVPVATTLSQGCTIIGPMRTITRGEGHLIEELDGEKVVDAFQKDLRSMAIKKIDQDPDTVQIEEHLLKDPDTIPDEFKSLFKGEVLVGFPVSESDQKEFLVRNIVSINEDDTMTISESIITGERLLFVHRDDASVAEDLCTNLLELRERVQKEHGDFKPKAAIYVSCLARAFSDPDSAVQSEIELIKDIIGDIPLTGFYAGGEINRARLYGYTGILTLFL